MLADPADPPSDLQAALRGMVDRPFLQSQRYAEQQKRAVTEGCHPDIIEFNRVMVKRCARHGIPMFSNEVYRSDERQQLLHGQGHSKAGPGQSPHQSGQATDIIHGVKGWNLNAEQWRLIGHIGKELATQKGIKLNWGGDDGPGDRFNWDPAHWEIADWKAQRDQYQFPRVMRWVPNWKKLHDEARARLREELSK